MSKSDIYYEMSLNASLLYSNHQINSEDFYRVTSILKKPQLIAGLELSSIVSLFSLLKINDSINKIPVISYYHREDVLDYLMGSRRINIMK